MPQKDTTGAVTGPLTLLSEMRDRIQSEIMTAILQTGETINTDDLVKQEMNKFFSPNGTFASIVRDELMQVARKRISDYLSSPAFDIQWDQYGSPVVSAEIEKLLIENSGRVLSHMIAGCAVTLIEDLKYKMRTNGVNINL